MSPIKQKIKDLSAEQVSLKNQRRTVRLVGERTTEPWQAQEQHSSSRLQIRNLLCAYAIIRGKDPCLGYPAYCIGGLYYHAYIQKLVDKYTAEYEAQKEGALRASEQSA